MASRASSPPKRGSAFALLALLLLALLLVSSLGGATAWVHTHGDFGPHVHLLPAFPGEVQHGELAAWHAAQHDAGQDRHAPQEPEDGPAGLRLEVPDVRARTARTLSQDISVSFRIQLALRVPDLEGDAHARQSLREHPPRAAAPRAPEGSGLLAVLRSSHAFLS